MLWQLLLRPKKAREGFESSAVSRYSIYESYSYPTKIHWMAAGPMAPVFPCRRLSYLPIGVGLLFCSC